MGVAQKLTRGPPKVSGWGSEEGAEEFFLAERIFRGGHGGEQGILAGVSLAVTQELCGCLGHLHGREGAQGPPKPPLACRKTPLEFLNPSLSRNLYPKSTPGTPNSTQILKKTTWKRQKMHQKNAPGNPKFNLEIPNSTWESQIQPGTPKNSTETKKIPLETRRNTPKNHPGH